MTGLDVKAHVEGPCIDIIEDYNLLGTLFSKEHVDLNFDIEHTIRQVFKDRS